MRVGVLRTFWQRLSRLRRGKGTMGAQEDVERYNAAMHAVQSGIAMGISRGDTETQPKHLRVGVNSALIETTAFLRLLLTKRIITEEEWFKALADEAEREVQRYEARLSKAMGSKIKLV